MDTSHTYPQPVTACVDGGPCGDRAVDYAIVEARRRHTGLHLLHVMPDLVWHTSIAPPEAALDLSETGQRILDEAAARARELAPDLTVTPVLAEGRIEDAVVRETASAGCLVLGTRHHGLGSYGGTTVSRVAAASTVPVVAVPPDWTPSTGVDRVLVGVDEHGGPDEVLDLAFQEAQSRGAELVVVHAWAPPTAYGASFAVVVLLEDFDAHGTDRLQAATEALREKYPDVRVDYVVENRSPKRVIPKLAGNHDLVVLGRHRSRVPVLHRLGSTAQHTIRSGNAPVLIVPPAADR
ncbi:universal stress protein [Nocardioides sp.]|uniref:universal stress protein n=1 Tax=Nocardioides sp. TaxID=35761 RepID=UPI002732B504|nr:universal stress protein [Nocardioides sp.]MDP3890541.1 universal stress protein [Nocardioides sp.]